ncbi:uncharacterized protein LOC129179194 isoform X3 [Dunckerocampus dactyliophorus]|uniref:uncharacterized protein LOC129179194 isoform X3 n=1 Tax=Dunckerocampus dactyliophorus TaxID=161453 RepID=UPI002406479F|nr:uncharacterized protein LOC129179194 isoform X3 [Dunckerocampus dactyliophorus]
MLKKLVKERLMAAAEEILSMFDRRIASYEGELARTRVEELVKERLMAAAGEILAMFDRRIASYEEELARMREEKERHRQQLEAVSKTGTVPQLKDVEQLGPQLQGGGATLKQDDPQTPHAKEEEEELWTTPEGDCLLGPEEADLTKFPLAGVSVKTEDHEDTPPESLQLHHSPHVQQLIGHQVERALQPQEGSSALKQEEQESLLHVKVEEEEAWTARDGACFLGPEEADLTQLPLTGVPVWTEYYEDTPRLLPEAEHGDYTQETLSDDIDCEGDKRSRSDSKHTECSKKKTTEEKGRLASCAMAEQRPKKRTQKSQRFLDRYGERWPCLVVSRLPYHAFCTVCKTDIDISHQGATGVQQLIDIKEEHPRQPQGGISTLKQEDPQPPNLKEEKEELWITQEADHLRGPEEADLLKLPLTGVSGKTEEHEDKPPESSQLHHSPCEENRGAEPPSSSSQHMTEADGDHRGGSQADELLAPLSGSDDTTPRSPEDEDTDDTREALSSDTDREEGSAHVVQGGQRAASDFLSDVDNSASPSCPEQFSFETSGNRLVVEKKVPLSRWVGRPLGGGRIPSPPILKGKMRNSASLMRVFKGGRRLISASCR